MLSESTGTLFFQNANGETRKLNAQIEQTSTEPNEEEKIKLGCMQEAEFTMEIEDSKPLYNFVEQMLKEIQVPLLIKQARKHRKKRINKKWLKRYGYKLILDGKMHPLYEGNK